jgi:pimeloyl-ACP methyl ester carboxylesterase
MNPAATRAVVVNCISSPRFTSAHAGKPGLEQLGERPQNCHANLRWHDEAAGGIAAPPAITHNHPMRPASVALLHGLGRTGLSMQPLALALRRAGYRTLAPTYSPRAALPAIIDSLAPRLARFAGDGPLHIVTHSFGGLVARALITADRPATLGRVVMLAPPNQGSGLADLLAGLGLDAAVLGGAATHLATSRRPEAERLLGTVDYDLGIIAGSRSFDAGLATRILGGPHDGKVSVTATRLPGMRDHIVLPVQHTLMLLDPRVIAETLRYLETGSFSASAARTEATTPGSRTS